MCHVDQATAGLVGAAIGAGGAIIAQVGTTIATNLAATKRFAWEQAQAIRRERNERSARFGDVKREMFTAFLTQNALLLEALEESLPPSDEIEFKEYVDRFKGLSRDITRLGRGDNPPRRPPRHTVPENQPSRNASGTRCTR